MTFFNPHKNFILDDRRAPQTIESTTDSPQPHSAVQRSTATYQPTSSLLPFGSVGASVKQELVAEELSGFWTFEPVVEDFDSTLWDMFFSNGRGQACLDKLRKDGHYGSFDLPGDAYTAQGLPNDTGRWKIPKTLPQEDKPVEEIDIVEAFVEIFNNVTSTLGMAETRVAVDGQRVPIRTRDQGFLKPDVFLWGKGSSAFPPISGKPKDTPHPRKANRGPQVQRHRKLLQKHQKTPPGTSKQSKKPSQKTGKKQASPTVPVNSVEEQPPSIDWPWCCVPIEVKTASERGTRDKPEAFNQLGTYVREVFAAQSHRRFVPSLVLTEQTVEFLLWDRAGVVVSHPMDYHAHALEFCDMLASLVTWDDQDLGFDPTAFYRGHQLHIQTKEVSGNSSIVVDYIVEETLIRSYTLRGQGSTCWRARRLNTNSHYIIQDSWVEGGMEHERDILHKIEAARVQHGIAGVAPFVHIENVQIPGTYPRSDTTKHNRRYDKVAGNVDLIHIRSVLSCGRNSRPLETITTSQDLVDTLKDVINAHGELYELAGVLHRDIVPWNIFIQPGAPEGHRGFLIGFSNAVCTNSISIRLQMTPGSHLFRCCNSLAQQLSNTHLDDLESFYWILCFIIGHHTRPGLATSRLEETPSQMRSWAGRDEMATAIAKKGHLANKFLIQVSDGFSRATQEFAINFHNFFSRRELEKQEERTRLPSDPGADYKELIKEITRAIHAEETLTLGTSGQRPSMFDAYGKRSLDAFDDNAPTSASKRFCIYLGLGLPLAGGDIARLGDIMQTIDVCSESELDISSEANNDSELDDVDDFLSWSAQD